MRYRGTIAALILYLCISSIAHAQIALSEMQTLAEGLDTCALDTIYYVSLETLDDTTNASSTPAYNYINDQGGTFVIPPDAGRFNATRVNLVTAFNHWDGPYLTYQPSRIQTGTTPYDQGSPLDPWGNPYYFFSPLGLLRGDSGIVTLELYGDYFDRYTLVSLGPDGVKSGDDIFYQFGGGITAIALSSVRAASSSTGAAALTVPAGSAIVVRGMNLGATQSVGKVLWGSQELTGVTSWSSREIAVTLPSNLQGINNLVMQRGTFTTNALSLTITAPQTAAQNWELYQ
jgi:hypothetical protein